ncbi:hypothetical protein DY000_02015759 [Brassica cretica]|uniref:Uncharacterized protein n=1 Tax=Brassica cretica TaxID=69181 RepID=A0ABQ7D8Q6_BRACR|nr:hypothetical protein DY000_02015759 [Brassica cretica]
MRSFQLGHPPNWTGPARRMAELVALSIQPGHPPNWTGPARRMAELVARLIQLGHPPNLTDPPGRMAELVAHSIHLGHPPGCPRVRSSSAIRRAGLFVFSSGVRLSLKLTLGNFYRECVEKISVRKCDFRS